MVMSIVLVGSGCSWIAVQGPPASDPGVRPVHCTETIIPPLLDTVPAVPLLGLAALLVAVGIKEHDNDVANTTASGWSRTALTSTRRVARGAAGQPAGDRARDREPHGGEAVGKVALRPRATARRCPTSLWPRGGNAAHVRR